jgi:hypothetical protein
MDGWVGGQTDAWVGGWVDRRVGGWAGGGWVDKLYLEGKWLSTYLYIYLSFTLHLSLDFLSSSPGFYFVSLVFEGFL